MYRGANRGGGRWGILKVCPRPTRPVGWPGNVATHSIRMTKVSIAQRRIKEDQIQCEPIPEVLKHGPDWLNNG